MGHVHAMRPHTFFVNVYVNPVQTEIGTTGPNGTNGAKSGP
jgi:hypothetical protein